MERIKNEAIRVFRAVSTFTWPRIILSFVAFVVPLLLFVQLADEVRDQETIDFDERALLAVYGISNNTLDAIVVATTDLGHVWGVGIATVIALVLCIQAHRYRSAAIVIVGVIGSALINVLLKLFFQRDRPELGERLITENSFSFPSGHAMASASIAAVIIVILWSTKWRYHAIVAGTLYAIYIGFTRMYLGVHYPTDIVAGWLVATAWVAITTIVITKFRRKKS